MIIYQSCPNRLYPTLSKALCGYQIIKGKDVFFENFKTFKYFYQYRDIFETTDQSQKTIMLFYALGLLHHYPDLPLPRKYKDITREYNKRNYIPFFPLEVSQNQDFQEKDIECLYGVFPGKRLNLPGSKRTNDFSFTFIDNPIDQIYNIYYYLEFLKNIIYRYIGYPYKKKNDRPEIDVSFQDLLYVNPTILFPTIEKFIDAFIEAKGNLIFNSSGIKFKICPEQYGFCTSGFLNHDFYGIIEDIESLERSFKILNNSEPFRNIGLEIKPEHLQRFYKQSSIIKRTNYRKEELINILRNDIDFYEQKRSIIYNGK